MEVSAGGTANYTITFQSLDGFSGDLTLSCSGQPQDGTCTFAPTTLTLSARGSASTLMTVTTTAADARFGFPASAGAIPGKAHGAVRLAPALWPFVGGFMTPLLIPTRKRSKRPRARARLTLLLLLALGLPGCGNSAAHQTYTITVAGTGGAAGAPVVESVSVELFVR